MNTVNPSSQQALPQTSAIAKRAAPTLDKVVSTFLPLIKEERNHEDNPFGLLDAAKAGIPSKNKSAAIKELAKAAYLKANQTGQNLLTNLLLQQCPQEYLPDCVKQSVGQDHNLTQESPVQSTQDFVAKLFGDSDQIPKIFKDIISNKIASEKTNSKDKDFSDVPQSLEGTFSAIDALDGKGSHQELCKILSEMSPEQIDALGPDFKQQIKDYQKALAGIPKALMRYAGMTQENLIGKMSQELGTIIDRSLLERSYARYGGQIADRNGGILGAGSIFNYRDGDLKLAGSIFQYKPDEYGRSSSSLEIRTLLPAELATAMSRIYVGQLTAEQPMPRFMTLADQNVESAAIPFDHDSRYS